MITIQSYDGVRPLGRAEEQSGDFPTSVPEVAAALVKNGDIESPKTLGDVTFAQEGDHIVAYSRLAHDRRKFIIRKV